MIGTRTFLVLLSVAGTALPAVVQTITPTAKTNSSAVHVHIQDQTHGNVREEDRYNIQHPDHPTNNAYLPTCGAIVNCWTPSDQKCLSLNKVPIDGKCYTVGKPGPCRNSEIVVVDKKEFQEFNVLKGVCRPIYSCNGSSFEEFMRQDQSCHDIDYIKNYICDSGKGLRMKKNVFGEGECVSVDAKKSSSQSGQAEELQEKQCYAPDLSFEFSYEFQAEQSRFPQLSVAQALWNVSVRCDAEERACLERGEVLVGRGAPGALADPAGCHVLLTRGPCPPGAWLVLDRRTLEEERRLAPVCDWARCAPSAVFLAESQRCVPLWELQHERCAGEDIVFDVFGEAHCTRYTTQAELLTLPSHEQDDECKLKGGNQPGIFGGRSLSPACAVTYSNGGQTLVNGVAIMIMAFASSSLSRVLS